MKSMKTILTLACCAIGISLLTPTAEAGKTYRWVDDDGTVHYTDKLPASEVKQARSQLNEHGIAVGHVEAAKTPEERAKAAEIARLRAEKEQLIAKQKEEDQVLLNTFHSEDDIIMAMNGKLTSLDVIIQIDHSNTKNAKLKLSELQSLAANQERQGKKVSVKLRAEIKGAQQRLDNIYQNILQREQEKKDLRKTGLADLKRFRSLKKLDESAQPKVEIAKYKASLLETVVTCSDKSSCSALWAKAEKYLQQHATTPMDILGSQVMMSRPPRKDDDVSITISQIQRPDEDETLIFLDLQCRPSSQGHEFCAGEKVTAIRSGFRSTLEGGTAAKERVTKDKPEQSD